MFWSDRNGALRVLLEDWEEQLIGESGPPDRQTWRNAAVRPCQFATSPQIYPGQREAVGVPMYFLMHCLC